MLSVKLFSLFKSWRYFSAGLMHFHNATQIEHGIENLL